MSISASFNLSAAAESAISVILSKESHVVACASDGVPKQGEIANAATDISVYKGDILLSVGTDWHIDALEASGATFTHTNDTCFLSAFNEGSLSGYVDITIKIGTVSIVRRFTVSKITDVPMYFTTGAAWSAAASYKNGQYLLLDEIIYVWSYPVSGNSTVSPKDDIINNPVTTHWKSYANWTLLATEIILANFGKLASAIFSGDYMYSQYGRTSSGVLTTEYDKFGTPDFSPRCKINYKTGEMYGENIIEKGANYNRWTEALFFDNTNIIRNMGVPYAGTDDLSNYIYNTRSGLVDVYITPVAAPQIGGGNSDVSNSVTFILSQKYGGSISGDIITINAFAQTRFLISGILVSTVKLYLATHIMFTYKIDGSSIYYLVMNSSDFTIEQDGVNYIAVAKHR